MSRKSSRRRLDRLSGFLAPGLRFWTGMILIPGYFMIDHPPAKLVLVLFFALLATLSGKRIRILYFIFLIGSITFFHLLTPVGRILVDLGPFKITEGALMTGLAKGLTLCGLVFLSLFSVTPALKLPGKLGGLLARTFYYFEEILDGKKRISPRNFIGSLDEVLLELFPPGDLDRVPEEDKNPPRGVLWLSVLYVFVMIGAVWGTLIWQILM